MLLVAIDLQYLKEVYFAYDEPVPYKCKGGNTINIIPVDVKHGLVFQSSVDIIAFDKNSVNDAKVISMSYLEFIIGMMSEAPVFVQKLVNILKLCLGLEHPAIAFNEQTNKPLIVDEEAGIKMEETDRLRNKDIDMPTFERKCAIITAHCGLSKKEQLEMTLRSHIMLFDEVCGEIEFTTVRPVALFGGKGGELEHWIYHKKKGKFDGYITEKSELVKQMGGEGSFTNTSTDTSRGDSLEQLFIQGGN